MKINIIKRGALGLLAAIGMMAATDGLQAQTITLQKVAISNSGGMTSDGSTSMTYAVGQPAVGTTSDGSTTATLGFFNEAMQISSVRGIVGSGSITSLMVYPNPAVVNSQVRLTINQPGEVEVLLYNSNGELVQRLMNDRREAGTVTIDFSVDNLPSGAYMVAARTPGAVVQVPISVTH